MTLRVVRFDRAQSLRSCSTIDPANVVAGQPKESMHEYARSGCGKLSAGIWACSPEKDRIADFPVDQFCLIVEGEVHLIDENGAVERFVEGDAFFIPRGFRGYWQTVRTVRKFYVMLEG
jgi:hypothetical protein